MKNTLSHSLSLFLLIAMPFQVFSADWLPEEESDIEVIEVTGQYPMGWYREQIFEKQEAYYKALNLLIDDEEFHVVCERVAGTGSLFEHYQVGENRRRCQPNFAATIREKMIFERTRGSAVNNAAALVPFNDREFRRRYLKEQDKLVEMVKTAIQKDPKLIVKIQEISQAQKAYQDAHIERFGKLSKYAHSKADRD